MSNENYYIIEANVDDSNKITWNSELEQERKSALFDLLNNGLFRLKEKKSGPFKLNIKLVEWKLSIKIYDTYDKTNIVVTTSVSKIRRIIRDYQIVCENYVEAIKTAPLKKIEAIDIGRRTIHDEGAEILISLLSEHLEIDIGTARRLFTLISILSIKI